MISRLCALLLGHEWGYDEYGMRRCSVCKYVISLDVPDAAVLVALRSMLPAGTARGGVAFEQDRTLRAERDGDALFVFDPAWVDVTRPVLFTEPLSKPRVIGGT